MATAETAQVITQISPTFVSTDLLTPHQKRRITIPAIGYHQVQRRPIGGKTWGENLTNYGGIGKLPFLGKTRARDLYVTRSLKHFGSGFSQYKSNVQPYQVTSLLKSGCRVNDQTIPPTFTVALDPEKYKLDYHDQIKERNPYFSHQSICEVFPRHDPRRCYLPGNIFMTDNTRQELVEKYTTMYNLPRYNACFPDHTEIMKEREMREKSRTPPRCDVADETLHDCKIEKCSGDRKIDPEKLDLESRPCACEPVPQCSREMIWDMEPMCIILSQLGSSLDLFTGKDILGIVLQYFGSAAVNLILDRVRDAVADDNCLAALKAATGDFSGFIMGGLTPLVKNLSSEGGDVYDILLSKSKEPETKPKEEKEEKGPIDARKQCQTLRSFIVGTNATSFDHSLIHPGRVKDEKVIPGRAPVWPPSGSYVLNRQRMKLQSYDSFPKNDTRLPAISPEEEPKPPSPKTPESKPPKQVRFSDTVISYDHPHKEGEKQQEGLDEGTSPTRLQWYKRYMDSLLPVPSVPKEPQPSRLTPIYPPSLTAEPVDASSRQAAAPPLVWRYPGSKVALTGGDWRTRSIADPNQYLKTLAQRRYHALHPDPVPDLRENHRFSKKYFFSGYHTSTFRG